MMICWKLSLGANLSTNGLVHTKWCVGPHLILHTKLLLDKRLKTSEVNVEFKLNKPSQRCLCLYYAYYACTMPTTSVLCLLFLCYAYYVCTMPTMPILCLIYLYYAYYANYACTMLIMPVLCLLYLHYAYYVCTMCTIPVLCLLCLYYASYAYL